MGFEVALLSRLVPTVGPRAGKPIDISLALEVSEVPPNVLSFSAVWMLSLPMAIHVGKA